MVPERQITNSVERMSAAVEAGDGTRQVKIRVERFDNNLGWYTSGSIVLAMEQLPLLEQAIHEMRAIERARRGPGCEIIPFPPLADSVTAAS